MKNYILAAVAIGAVILWQRGTKKQESKNAVEAAIHTDGTNWVGDMWQRLAGADLVHSTFANFTQNPTADLSKVSQSDLVNITGNVPYYPL